VIVAPSLKLSTSNIPSLSQKTDAITLEADFQKSFQNFLDEVNFCVSTPWIVLLSLDHKNVSMFHQLSQVEGRNQLCSI